MKNSNGCLLGYLIFVCLGILAALVVAIAAFRPALDIAGW